MLFAFSGHSTLMQAPSTRMPSKDSMASWAASRTSYCIQRCGCRRKKTKQKNKPKIFLSLLSGLKLLEKGLGKGPELVAKATKMNFSLLCWARQQL